MAYRRAIRINGKLKKSPPFDRKSDADRWYAEKLRDKQFLKSGLHLPLNEKTTLKTYFYGTWLPNRKVEYTKATWGADEQRFRDYVEDVLGYMRVSKINSLMVKSCLKDVCVKHGQSTTTRTRVRALLSKLFGDAMNEDPPLRLDNPALNITFPTARVGKKLPKHIKTDDEVNTFLNAAKDLSFLHFVYAALSLMAAPRKSETAAFKWNCFIVTLKLLVVKARFVQAENKIMPGTKAGREESRDIPIPDTLVKILLEWRELTSFAADGDFILCRPDGKNFSNRELARLHDEIRKKSGVEATPHALRHTYGRKFAQRSGNKKALQAILGHSNSATTDIYSDLAGSEVADLRNTVDFDVKEKP